MCNNHRRIGCWRTSGNKLHSKKRIQQIPNAICYDRTAKS
jgi:hypothetical protein